VTSTQIHSTSPLNHGKATKKEEWKIILTTGMALFAMFFGAGNILFPLHLGANAGETIGVSALGFLLMGVGVPFLGLLATSLYQGSYHAFFARLGEIPGFLMITFLMVIIGPLAAIPRTETTTFHTLLPYLPEQLHSNTIFSLIYCAIVFVLAYRETKVVEILGLFFSPIKLISFTCLIIVGFIFSEPILPSTLTTSEAFYKAMVSGYNTMDLLASFFYCSVAFTAIEIARKKHPSLNSTTLTLKSCILGAFITGAVYIGFMLTAYNHAQSLRGLAEEQMISAISMAVLGKFGGLFVCVSVSFACIATALALVDVCTIYLHEEVFKEKIPHLICLTSVVIVTYLMSNLGFQAILKFSIPILQVIYPALIGLCIFNILHKTVGVKMVKTPVLIIILLCIYWYKEDLYAVFNAGFLAFSDLTRYLF
jgi:LIVCS family branched-chain amino acid:cation transporter